MKIDIQKHENGYLCRLEGWIDTNASIQFRNETQVLFDNAEKNIDIDCKDVEFISSSGLRVFLALRKECAAKGGHIVITNINEEVKNVFTLTGFYNLFDIK